MILILLAGFFSVLCFGQNIYNDGTAWRMPRDLHVSDFYYDIGIAIQYEGRHQEYFLPVKSFFWQDEKDPNHTIESAFFIVKRWASGGSFDYALQYRRYIVLANEKPNSENVRSVWDRWRGGTDIVRGSTLHLKDSGEDYFTFGWANRELWNLLDGLFERAVFSMYFEEQWGPLLDQLLHSAEKFIFCFPSLNPEINPFELSSNEINLLMNYGIFPELEDNSFTLTSEELEALRHNLVAFIAQKKLERNEYFEIVRNHQLR